MNPERRSGAFIERLSCLLVVFSALGAALVLIDPMFAIEFGGGTMIKIGGNGFSDQLKGAVVMLVLIAGFTATVNYWLGASDQGAKAQDTINSVAANSSGPGPGTPSGTPIKSDGTGSIDPSLKTDTINVVADTATITPATPTTEGETKP